MGNKVIHLTERMFMSNKGVYILMIGVLGLTLFFFSCRNRKTVVSSFKGGYISRYGQYTTEAGAYTIEVSEHPKGLLIYSVSNQDGAVLIDSDKADVAVLIYQKWRLYWDKSTEYLWLDSSDRGIFVWIKQEDGSYTHNTYSPKGIPSLKGKIPDDIRKKLEECGAVVY